MRLSPGVIAATAIVVGAGLLGAGLQQHGLLHRELPAPAPLEVFGVPSLAKVLPDTGRLPSAAAPPLRVSLARNETESTQLVVRSRGPLTGVALRPGPLRRDDGVTLAADAVRWSAVGFVRTRKPDYDVEHVGRWPDPLLGAVPVAVEPGAPQPFWIRVSAGAGAAPGRYLGQVEVLADGRTSETVPIEVTVWDFALPEVPRLQTAFDIYLGRVYLAYERLFPEWGRALAERGVRPEHIQQAMIEDLVAHRLAPILNAQPDTRGDADALRRLSGLSAFGIGPFGGSFDNFWPDDHADVARRFRGYAKRLAADGLLARHYVYAYDEPEPGLPAVAAITKRLHDADPRLRTLVVVGSDFDPAAHADWLRDIDIVCLRNVVYDPKHAAALRAMGKQVWMYASGPTPPFPSLVIDSPAMAARIIPWMCWKFGATGFLYWSVNYWTKDPYRDPMNTKWDQNGNGLLYYPGPAGPVGSIRLELLRDGMDDYDYLSLLAEQAARVERLPSLSDEARARVAEARRALAIDETLVASPGAYTQDPDRLLAARAHVADLIQQLQRVRP